MGGLIDIMSCAGYTNCRLTQVLGRRFVSSGGKIWLIFKDASRSSQAPRAASAGRSHWRWPSTAPRLRSISRRAPRMLTQSSRKSVPLADERSRSARTYPSARRSPIWRRASQTNSAPSTCLVNNAGIAISGRPRGGFRPWDRRQSEIGLPVHRGGPAGHDARVAGGGSSTFPPARREGRACSASSTTRQRPGSRA